MWYWSKILYTEKFPWFFQMIFQKCVVLNNISRSFWTLRHPQRSLTLTERRRYGHCLKQSMILISTTAADCAMRPKKCANAFVTEGTKAILSATMKAFWSLTSKTRLENKLVLDIQKMIKASVSMIWTLVNRIFSESKKNHVWKSKVSQIESFSIEKTKTKKWNKCFEIAHKITK